MKLFSKLFGSVIPTANLLRDQALERTGLEAVDRVFLPSAVADQTQANLRTAGLAGNEGMVAWSGVHEGSNFEIRSAIVPPQRGIRSAEGVCVILDPDALHELNVAIYKRGERLFAQVHTHPGRAYHSAMDDRYAIVTAAGGLSLVVPDFAVRPFSVRDCAIYRLTQGGRWTEVSERQKAGLISVVGGSRP